MTIRLDKIITRGGDKGETSLGDGTRIRKDDRLIEAIGVLDELNAVVGFVRLHCSDRDELVRIQNILFDIGALLCVPGREDIAGTFDQASCWLDDIIIGLRDMQPPLRSFVLPGGSVGACWAHLARTNVRTAERRLVGLNSPRLAGVMVFLNRLSDYFFVLARHQNDHGHADIVWARQN